MKASWVEQAGVGTSSGLMHAMLLAADELHLSDPPRTHEREALGRGGAATDWADWDPEQS